MVGIDDIRTGITQNLGTIAVGAGVAAIGGGVALAALTGSKSKKRAKRSRKKITHTRRGWKQDRKRKSKQPWEVAYRRRKKRSRSHKRSSKRGIHYTKNGQPYKILSSGKARFIKKTKRRSR